LLKSAFIQDGLKLVNYFTIGGITDVSGNNTAINYQVKSFDINALAVKEQVTVYVGQSRYIRNGQSFTMDIAPYIKSNRTYFPIRYVAESLGASVSSKK